MIEYKMEGSGISPFSMGMFFKIIGSLGLFLYGMRVMSSGIQKAAGNKMQSIMNFITQNRVVAVFTGFFTTALIQSSSATTVMVVSFVNAALLTLPQAIGVIMGANIGTTITTWIVSIVGFKFKISTIALPMVGLGLPFIFSKVKKRRDLGEILIGFGLLFLGLMFLKESVPDIRQSPQALAFLQNFTDRGLFSWLIFVAAGTVLTIMVQSSSAALAITVTMAFMGWIDLSTGAAIVLGENIGTTVTAYLASIGTHVNARRAARAHLLFNLFGVLWISLVFHQFLDLVLRIAPWNTTLQVNLPLNLALFHSCFNIINTLIFLPFVTPFSRLVKKLVRSRKSDEEKDYALTFRSTGIQNTAQVRILEAKKEIEKMAILTKEMFATFLHIFHNPDKKMGDKVDRVKTQEDLTDRMQEEIIKYLMECAKESLSETSIMDIRAMMRIVNELENIADSCFKLMILTERKYHKKIIFHKDSYREVTEFSNKINEFMKMYIDNINRHINKKDLERAFNLENQIDNLRDKLKKAAERRMQKDHDVKGEVMYLDFLRHFEHIGDYSLNVAQALVSIK